MMKSPLAISISPVVFFSRFSSSLQTFSVSLHQNSKCEHPRHHSRLQAHSGNKDLFSPSLDPRDNDALLDYSIDSFLRGEYDGAFSDDAASPIPGLSPRDTVESALLSLRALDDPEPAHGAAVLLRFCAPLSRAERWEGIKDDQWKELVRGAIGPTMLAKRIRASEFSGLLDFEKLVVTDGAMSSRKEDLDRSTTFVNVALYFEDEVEPTLMEFKLSQYNGVWLISRGVIR
jgi:hypothetical protein